MYKLVFINNTETPKPQERNLKLLTSFVHSILGNNNPFHNNKANIAVTPLIGGTYIDNKTEVFPDECCLYIQHISDNYLKGMWFNEIIETARGKMYGDGLICTEVIFIPEPMAYDGMVLQTFRSGIVLKHNTDNGYEYLKFNDERFIPELTNHCKRVLKKLNPSAKFDDLNFEIVEHKNNKSFNYILKNCKITSNVLKLKINCSDSNAIQTILETGLGNSKGCGFGMVFPEEDWREYLIKYNKKK